MRSSMRSFISLVGLLSSSAIAATSCGDESQSSSEGGRRDSAAHGAVADGGGAAVAGNGASVASSGSSALPDLGRPSMLPPVIAAPPGAASGCLEAVVLFVIDGSGSMCDVFGSSTRWTAMRSALLAPMVGLIPQLAAEAQFGMMITTARSIR